MIVGGSVFIGAGVAETFACLLEHHHGVNFGTNLIYVH
jgi:hypothetical protein